MQNKTHEMEHSTEHRAGHPDKSALRTPEKNPHLPAMNMLGPGLPPPSNVSSDWPILHGYVGSMYFVHRSAGATNHGGNSALICKYILPSSAPRLPWDCLWRKATNFTAGRVYYWAPSRKTGTWRLRDSVCCLTYSVLFASSTA